MLKDFTLEEAEEVFKIEYKDWDRYHQIIEGLMICYCFMRGEDPEELSEKAYTEEEANALVASLVKDAIRIPRVWGKIDRKALERLLEDINFHKASSDLFDIMSEEKEIEEINRWETEAQKNKRLLHESLEKRWARNKSREL